MSLWILDTDHISLFLAGNKLVMAQVGKHSKNVAITVITVQELFNGWNGRINDPKQADRLSFLYTKLWKTTNFIKSITILNFDSEAENCYLNLRLDYKHLAKKRIAKDMRIAAIALTQNAIVATRNQKDFSQVPGLTIENWA